MRRLVASMKAAAEVVVLTLYSKSKDCIVHSLSSGKVEMFLCAACHALTPHVNAWKL